MTRSEQLMRNPRLLFWARFFTMFKMLNAIVTLFYLQRGLSLEQTVWLSGIFGLFSLLFEVPSGYLADRLGRKWTLISGVVLLILSDLIHLVAFGFPAFIIAFVFLSAASSCFSGTEEALLYDTLKEQEKEKETTRYFSRLLSAQNLPKILLPGLGALIAKDLLEWQFSILLWTNIGAAMMALFLYTRITEPKHTEDVSAQEKNLFKESFDTIRHKPFLFFASLNKVIPFVATILVWRVYQPYVVENGFPIAAMGFFYLIIHTIMFLLKWSAEPLEKYFGSARTLNMTAFLMAFWIIIAAVVQHPLAQVIAIGFCFISHSIREPMYSQWINQHIHSRSRATTLSSLAVFRGALDIPIMFFGGILAAYDTRYALFLAATLCLIVLVFFRIPRHNTV